MAAGSARDQMRFTNVFPILQARFNQQNVDSELVQSLGNLQQLMDATTQLLEVAYEANQADRIEVLLAFEGQLQQLGEQASAAAGRPIDYSTIDLRIPHDQFQRVFAQHLADSSEGSLTNTSGSDEEHSTEEPEEPCPICFDDYPARDMRSLLGCGEHRYCHNCMDQHLSTLIRDSELKTLSCPSPGCPVVPAEYEIENLVSAETYERYLQFAATASLRSEQGAKWCPSCKEAIIWDPSQKKVVCPGCKHEFCFDCGRAPHAGQTCQAAASGAPDGDDSLQDWLKEKGVKVKPCPSCHEGIEKNDGCNHMTCQQCHAQWCWLCLGTYSPSHFSTGTCAGLQFSRHDTLEEALQATSSRNTLQTSYEPPRRVHRHHETHRLPRSVRRGGRKAAKAAKIAGLIPLVVVGSLIQTFTVGIVHQPLDIVLDAF